MSVTRRHRLDSTLNQRVRGSSPWRLTAEILAIAGKMTGPGGHLPGPVVSLTTVLTTMTLTAECTPGLRFGTSAPGADRRAPSPSLRRSLFRFFVSATSASHPIPPHPAPMGITVVAEPRAGGSRRGGRVILSYRAPASCPVVQPPVPLFSPSWFKARWNAGITCRAPVWAQYGDYQETSPLEREPAAVLIYVDHPSSSEGLADGAKSWPDSR